MRRFLGMVACLAGMHRFIPHPIFTGYTVCTRGCGRIGEV